MLSSIKVQGINKYKNSRQFYNYGFLGHLKKIAQNLMSNNSEEIQSKVLESKSFPSIP